MKHTLQKKLMNEILLLSYSIYLLLIQHSLKSDQLRHEFQEITSHHGVAVVNGWIKTTSLPSPSARGHCHKGEIFRNYEVEIQY